VLTPLRAHLNKASQGIGVIGKMLVKATVGQGERLPLEIIEAHAGVRDEVAVMRETKELIPGLDDRGDASVLVEVRPREDLSLDGSCHDIPSRANSLAAV
jgi:hypothetical protein